MDVGGWEDPAFALVCHFLWPWASCNRHWPDVALMVTSKFEILRLCHELNWHLFPEGISNLLGDNRQATIIQLKKPCWKLSWERNLTWPVERWAGGKEHSSWCLQWEIWTTLTSSAVVHFSSWFNILENVIFTSKPPKYVWEWTLIPFCFCFAFLRQGFSV